MKIVAIAVTICSCSLSGHVIGQKWRLLHLEEEALQVRRNSCCKKLKLHVWFMRLGYFLTFFIIALEWCSISDVLQVEVYFDMLGCIYKKLYFSLNST